jgi:ATP-dependent RNA circularization protein (DNA/RNA ligase family)
MLESEDNLFWKMYDKYIKPIFDAENHIAIQAELVGPGIQKNRMGLADFDIRVFNVFDTFNQQLFEFDKQLEFCAKYNLPHVPVVWRGVFEPKTIEELLEMAKGNYEGTKNPREGLVFRPVIPQKTDKGERLSFKVINNDYLLSGGE